MSTKTLRKRIALVAVSALGAGLLSVVPMSSANAAVIPGGITLGANDTTGTAVLNATSGTARSTGLVSITNNSTTAITAVLLASGKLSVATDRVSATAITLTVSGGTVQQVTGGTYNSSQTIATSTSDTAMGAYIVPNAGSTLITLQSFNGTSGALISTALVTVSTTSQVAALSTATSTVYWGTGSTDTAVTDATASNSNKANGQVCAGEISVKDAYSVFIPNSTGVVTITATGGALAKLTSASSAGTSNVDYNTANTAAAIAFNVRQATANVPLKSTVTVSYNGVEVATKTCVIAGSVASMTASSPKIGKVGGSANTSAALVTYKDSAGNAVYPQSGTTAVSASVAATKGVVTALTLGTAPTTDGVTPGLVSMTCSLSGAAKGLQLQHLNEAGVIIKSNTWDAGCADVPYTVTASWDKASYAPGTVATLTLSFKDEYGNPGNAYDQIGSSTTGLVLMTVTGGPSEAAVTPIAGSDKPSGLTGAKTYQFTVGTTEGDFIAVIVPTEVIENNPLGQANISAPYSVKSTSGAVSNADVLKAIVSLIASINKQIAALQKALLRR
jgi:hypothetical protein